MLNALRLAIQFFSTIPVGRVVYAPTQFCLAAYYYPLVGLIIGGILALLAWGLPAPLLMLNSVWVLSAWVLLTGGLHWDGLADTADAWFAGVGDKPKTLRIMKDPCVGPIAVLTLLLVFSVKLAALFILQQQQAWVWILLSPVVARTWVLVLLVATPYAKPEGFGAALSAYLQWRWVVLVGVGSVMFSYVCLPHPSAILWLWGSTLVLLLGLRQRMLARLQGLTGDTAGACIVLQECWVLVCGAYWSS